MHLEIIFTIYWYELNTSNQRTVFPSGSYCPTMQLRESSVFNRVSLFTGSIGPDCTGPLDTWPTIQGPQTCNITVRGPRHGTLPLELISCGYCPKLEVRILLECFLVDYGFCARLSRDMWPWWTRWARYTRRWWPPRNSRTKRSIRGCSFPELKRRWSDPIAERVKRRTWSSRLWCESEM